MYIENRLLTWNRNILILILQTSPVVETSFERLLQYF